MFLKKIFLLLFFNIFALSAQIKTKNVIKKDSIGSDSIIKIQKKRHLLGLKYIQDSLFYFSGKRVSDTLHLYIKNNSINDSVISTFEQIENDINSINRQYYSKGYVFNKLEPAKIVVHKKQLKIYYDLINLSRLCVDSISFTSKLPGNILKHIDQHYLGKAFSELNTKDICTFISNNTSFTATNTNILFKKKQNILNIDVKKLEQNTIDGLLSFGYDTQKKELLVNGQLNSILYNVLNANEKIQMRWQKTGEFQNYMLKTDFPYLFGSNFEINNTFQLQRKDTTELNLFNKIEFGWKHNSHNTSIHLSSEQIKRTNNPVNQIYIGVKHQYLLAPNKLLSKFDYQNKLINSFSINIPGNSKLFYVYNEFLYSFATIKNQGVLLAIQNYISNSNNPNQLLSSINDVDRDNTISFNRIKSIQLIKSSYYFAIKDQFFYTIHNFVNENTIAKQHKKYINIGIGWKILRKNQNITLKIYTPIFLSKLADYQKVYISIKQVFRF